MMSRRVSIPQITFRALRSDNVRFVGVLDQAPLLLRSDTSRYKESVTVVDILQELKLQSPGLALKVFVVSPVLSSWHSNAIL